MMKLDMKTDMMIAYIEMFTRWKQEHALKKARQVKVETSNDFFFLNESIVNICTYVYSADCWLLRHNV